MNRALVVLTVVSGVVAVVLGAAYVVEPDADPGTHRSQDLDGNVVEWDEAPDVTGSRPAETGELFVAPRQGLSVPLSSAVVTGGEINPPTLTEAYWYRDWTDPARPDGGTVVVAMHAVREGRGPGNAFMEVTGAGVTQVRLERGDPLRVGRTRYRVVRWLVGAKQATARDPDVWGDPDRGNRLVLVTCLLADVPASQQENLVVIARRTP